MARLEQRIARILAGAGASVLIAGCATAGGGGQGGAAAARSVGVVHPVKFEVGKTEFAKGDGITITDVRGTSPTFGRGNTYVVTGRYTLASVDSARLAVYVTASDPKEAWGPSAAGQTVNVGRGSGTFTLVLPMAGSGWPHASFYNAGGGGSLGGTYFGTGPTVMRREGKGQARAE